MFNWDKDRLQAAGAAITVAEIKQQPELWLETLGIYQTEREAFLRFLQNLQTKHDFVRVILTGAGTSAYVADTALPYIKHALDGRFWQVEAVATTSIVANPDAYFQANVPTLLVSYARSGNSPESLAAVKLGQKHVNDFYQLTITCAPDGKLALAAEYDANNFKILMPSRSNDQGFAMTGSYTCMLLTTLLLFGQATEEDKAAWVERLASYGREVIAREDEIAAFIKDDFKRIVYLGSGPHAGLAREVQLKILELTAGRYATAFDSSMGFRHGPKSFIDADTLVFVFKSNNPYTRQYDVDILEEMHGDGLAKAVVGVGLGAALDFSGTNFNFKEGQLAIPDAYMALPLAMFGQALATMAALGIENKPDTPNPSGMVNRVVKGVTIHEEV